MSSRAQPYNIMKRAREGKKKGGKKKKEAPTRGRDEFTLTGEKPAACGAHRAAARARPWSWCAVQRSSLQETRREQVSVMRQRPSDRLTGKRQGTERGATAESKRAEGESKGAKEQSTLSLSLSSLRLALYISRSPLASSTRHGTQEGTHPLP